MTNDLWMLYQTTRFILPNQSAVSYENERARFAIVSARNTQGKQQTEQQNQQYEERMECWLQSEDIDFQRIYGCSPTLDYIEPSYQINIPDKTAAVELSRLFRQNALFWIEHDQLWLVPCRKLQFAEVKLGLFSERLMEFAVL